MMYSTTLRWRIHDGKLPLRQRHVRALQELNLPDALIGWVHERLEWAMLNMLAQGREAVLVLDIDPTAEVRISLDEVRDPPQITLADMVIQNGYVLSVEKTLIVHDGTDCATRDVTGDIWIERSEGLFASCEQIHRATSTLCRDLAETLGYSVQVAPQLIDDVAQAAERGQAFMISDEFGFLLIDYVTEAATDAIMTSNMTEVAENDADFRALNRSATIRIREAFARLW